MDVSNRLRVNIGCIDMSWSEDLFEISTALLRSATTNPFYSRSDYVFELHWW